METTQACECGSREFVTEPNAYDVYGVIDGQLGFIRTEQVEEDVRLFCRTCRRELKTD